MSSREPSGPAAAPHAATLKARNKSVLLHYNDRITLIGILIEAYRYLLGSRSAIEWIVNRYNVNMGKVFGIINNPNRLVPRGRQLMRILVLPFRIVTSPWRRDDRRRAASARHPTDGARFGAEALGGLRPVV